MTSHDVVAKLRRILSTKKIGHTGTLDPQVTGVLPIAIGQATKLSEYVMDGSKVYEGTMVLGIRTDTEDMTGNVVECLDTFEIPEISEIESGMKQLTGTIEQTPPMYSAVKINGQKLYELARKGIEVERKPRLVTVYSFSLSNPDIPMIVHEGKQYPLIFFRVHCSKGTYARTLCVQLGQILGLPASMSTLQRTEAGGFNISDSCSLEEVEQAVQNKRIDQCLKSMDQPIQSMPAIYLSEQWSHKLYNGVPYRENVGQTSVDPKDLCQDKLFRIYDVKGVFFAIYRLSKIDALQIEWKAEKVFHKVLV